MQATSTGKTIKVFLANGSAKGLRTAEIGNWTGKAVVCPRLDLPELAKRGDIGHAGVYILVGQDLVTPDTRRVYVGESENVIRRLVDDHDNDSSKDWWEDTIVLVSKDENLTKSHVLFLESLLIAQIASIGKACCVNVKKAPKKLPESDAVDMRYFLRQIEILLPALGFDFLEPDPVVSSNFVGTEFAITIPKSENALAHAVELEGSFVVKAGSRARKDEAPTLAATYAMFRADLMRRGKLESEGDGLLRFTSDVAFTSPSAAASVVTGAQTNGREKWVTLNGQTYGEWHAAQIKVERAA